jgi:hypothetical protein
MINEDLFERIVDILLELKINPGLRADFKGDVEARVHQKRHGGSYTPPESQPASTRLAQGETGAMKRYRKAAARQAARKVAKNLPGSRY